MIVVDTRIDVADLDTGTSIRSAAGSTPGIHRIDDLVTLAQAGIIEGVVLDSLHHWRRGDCRQWRPVKLNCDSIKRDIELVRNRCSWRMCSQPTFEFVAFRIQLRAV